MFACFNQFSLGFMEDPKMIMIVGPNNAGDRHAVIKKLNSHERTIPA